MMLNSAFGGSWTPDGGFSYFGSETDALYEGAEYISATGSWGGFWGMARTFEQAATRFNNDPMRIGKPVVSRTSEGYITIG
ncbi:hypothetical protein, partial [Pararcticibacter amylolyticus]